MRHKYLAGCPSPTGPLMASNAGAHDEHPQTAEIGFPALAARNGRPILITPFSLNSHEERNALHENLGTRRPLAASKGDTGAQVVGQIPGSAR